MTADSKRGQSAAAAGHRHHDMGGAAAGACRIDEHEYERWEKRVDALMMLLQKHDPKLLAVDELRRNIEALGPEAYDGMGYYERWMHSLGQVLLQRGVLTSEEIGRLMEER